MERPAKYLKPLTELERVQEDGLALRNMPPSIQDNPEIVMAAVRNNGNAIRYASENLQRNREIILTALRTPGVFRLLLPEIQDNREFLLAAVKTHNPQFFHQLPPELQNDEEVVMAYISGIENADSSIKKFAHVPDQFKNNPRVVLAAVSKLSTSLHDANPALLQDKEFAINCVHANFNSLQYLPAFQDDNDVMLEAISIDGRAIKYASDRIKKDREFVVRAVRQTGRALYYIDESLKNDEAIVRVAMETQPFAIVYTSEQFQRQHYELVRHAVIRDFNILYYLPLYHQDISLLQLIPPNRRTKQQKEILRDKGNVVKALGKVGYPLPVTHKIQQMLGGKIKKKRKTKNRKK
jgi:hypothetical protein